MTDVRVPKVGMSTIEVEVLDVLVAPGDTVAEGDPLLNIAADKVDLSIEAPAAGVVSEVLVQEGDTIEVGDVVLRLVAP
jgi:pyruvate/2-oxoglutarate dehydrogenase complex dihydrolipoamide acyltransferase (E2) component